MKDFVLAKMRSSVSVVALGAVLSCGVVLAPARADISLTSSQASSVNTALTAQIQAANGDQVAIEAAIAQAVESAIGTYGADATASIVASAITAAETAGATSDEIGDAIAQASDSFASSDVRAARAIARAMATEAKTDEIAAFQSTITADGFPNLASVAGETASPYGATGGNAGSYSNNNGNGFNGGSGGSGGSGGCLNPSCTKL